ncbi:MAG TPA: cytochrome c peroxidase [Pyrinomonadaceae bacterium]|nr:cytochrome c peroxidase [Pyrinomonadaceae bacterium]
MRRIFLCILFLACVVPVHAFQSGPEKRLSAKSVGVEIPVGIKESLWAQRIPKHNPLSKEKIALGRALYFDKRLSIDGTVSCATCHDPALAFTDGNVVAVGGRETRGTRNAPTLLNTVFNQIFFWDGRARTLEEQVKHPLLSSSEMGMTSEKALVARLESIPEYQKQFKRIFSADGLTIDTVAKAIAAYERTLLSGNSPFDRFIWGQRFAISDAQKRGWDLFKGKARCSECHTYSPENQFFTDFEFHNTGIAAGELGRFAVSRQPADTGAFKTPTLRDLELTAPYMHDGSLKTLIDVVQFYNRGGNANRYLDKRMLPLQLTDVEVNDLVQFLRALTSDDVLRQCQSTTPQTRVPVPL